MFDTAFVIIDELSRPILLIPEELPEGETFLNIVAGGIDIGVDKKVFGRIRDMEDETLALLGLHEKVGMAAYTGDGPEELPDEIAYIATVADTRFG